MMHSPKGILAALTLLAATIFLPHTAFAEPCTPDTFEDTDYIICTVQPGKDDLRLFWGNAEGKPYRTFSSVADAMEASGKTLIFAVNAGMYQSDFSPMGLYVEDSRERHPVNIDDAKLSERPVPNFFKKPNGVFFLGDTGAGILPTEAFLKQSPKVRFATQSGPMLVIRNTLHPVFIVGSTDRTRRSGVGLCAGGTVRFAISEDDVNFNDFARLFRDHLQCPDALFLDGGNGVGLYNPVLGRNDRSWHGGYGPILGLVE